MFESLKFASLDEVWSPKGVSVHVENPYKPEHEVVNKATSPVVENACQQYLEDVYESQGVHGLLKVLDPVMVRDIQALAHPVTRGTSRHSDSFSLSFDELILIAFGIFAIILATE